MAGQLRSHEVVTLEEMVLAQMFEQEALINLLDRKGLIRKTGFLDGVKRLRAKAAKLHQPAQGCLCSRGARRWPRWRACWSGRAC